MLIKPFVFLVDHRWGTVLVLTTLLRHNTHRLVRLDDTYTLANLLYHEVLNLGYLATVFE